MTEKAGMDTRHRAERQNVTYFASGSNHAGEIQGFARAGMHVGATANELCSGAFSEICDLKAPTRFFFDSGAFSEVQERPGGPPVLVPEKRISVREWNRRLGMALEIGKDLGDRLYAVAPDRVGSQEVTIKRLRRYSDLVHRIRETGARILVCLQMGVRALPEMDDACADALGFDDFIRAIPMKKSATPLWDILPYLESRKPKAIHLLGLGVHVNDFDVLVTALRNAHRDVEISCDSVIIRALVGRYNNGHGRPLTLAADKAAEQCLEWWNADCGDLDWTDEIATPSWWTTERERRVIANKCGYLTVAEKRRFVKDPDNFLQEIDVNGEERFLCPILAIELDRAWRRYAVGNWRGTGDGRKRFVGGRGNVTFRKREAIVRVFGDRRYG